MKDSSILLTNLWKKNKQIDIIVFDIHIYWNVTSNTSIISSNTFKSFMIISDFSTFRSFKKLEVDIRMRLQSAERFKWNVQQIFEELNLERSRIESLSNQLIKNLKKRWVWWFRKRDCLFEMIIRIDYLISWRLPIMIKRRSLIEKKTYVTRWILLFLCYFCCSYTELIFHSRVSYIF